MHPPGIILSLWIGDGMINKLIMKHPLIFNLSLILILLAGCSKGPTEPVLTTAPVEGKSFSIPDINLDMLWCKPGTFMMGSPEDEKSWLVMDETQYEVTLTKGFWLGKYEVTQEQWEKVMGSNPSKFKGVTLPVEQVNWDDAIKFCEKLTQMEKAAGRLPEGWAYTLPTEAQWEYACRAGTTTAYSFGDSITSKQANYEVNVGKTTPVGIYPANAWGFHDMHGNVWERCLDWYGDYPSGPASDPVGPSVGSWRVSRGGSWDNDGRYLRSAYRGRFPPDSRYLNLGFRLSLQTEKKERSDP
jgi:formylglycine-generating enzyme